MCCLQLALWNIPGVAVVGNTLAMETREVFYTPAHYLYRWDDRLAIRGAIEVMRELTGTDPNKPEDLASQDAHQAPAMAEATTTEPKARPLLGASGTPVQFDFGL